MTGSQPLLQRPLPCCYSRHPRRFLQAGIKGRTLTPAGGGT
jgi:hypothetical protein